MDVITLSREDIQEALSCEEKLRMILTHVPRSDRSEIQLYKFTALDAFSMLGDFVMDFSDPSERMRNTTLEIWYPEYISSLRKAYEVIGRIQNHVSMSYRLETQEHVNFLKEQIGKHIRLFSKLMERQINRNEHEKKSRTHQRRYTTSSTSNPSRIRSQSKKNGGPPTTQKRRLR